LYGSVFTVGESVKGESDIRDFPLTRPIAIIRSSDLTIVNSPPTPPANSIASSPHHHQEHPDVIQHQHLQSDVNQSPPESPQAQLERKAGMRIASPYATGRDYAFNHFHTQQTQVSCLVMTQEATQYISLCPQLFSYPSTMSSSVINPTNLSLYSTPVTTPRSTPRARWNNPFLLEEDFNMMSHPVSNNNPDSVILMEEGEWEEVNAADPTNSWCQLSFR
jgi:hypothetical protein